MNHSTICRALALTLVLAWSPSVLAAKGRWVAPKGLARLTGWFQASHQVRKLRRNSSDARARYRNFFRALRGKDATDGDKAVVATALLTALGTAAAALSGQEGVALGIASLGGAATAAKNHRRTKLVRKARAEVIVGEIRDGRLSVAGADEKMRRTMYYHAPALQREIGILLRMTEHTAPNYTKNVHRFPMTVGEHERVYTARKELEAMYPADNQAR